VTAQLSKDKCKYNHDQKDKQSKYAQANKDKYWQLVLFRQQRFNWRRFAIRREKILYSLYNDTGRKNILIINN
jgi:hypothetical protein